MYVLRTGLGADGVDLSTLYPGISPDSIPSSACTCINGTCAENGNSCSSVSPAGPVGSPAYIAQQQALQNAAVAQLQLQMPFNITDWVNQNAGKIAIGAGAFVALMIFTGGRR